MSTALVRQEFRALGKKAGLRKRCHVTHPTEILEPVMKRKPPMVPISLDSSAPINLSQAFG